MTSFVLIDRTSNKKTNRIWGNLRSSNHFPPQLGKQSDHVLPGSPVYTPAARLETTPWERTLPPRSTKVKAKAEVVVYLRDRRSGERTLVQGEEFAP